MGCGSRPWGARLRCSVSPCSPAPGEGSLPAWCSAGWPTRSRSRRRTSRLPEGSPQEGRGCRSGSSRQPYRRRPCSPARRARHRRHVGLALGFRGRRRARASHRPARARREPRRRESLKEARAGDVSVAPLVCSPSASGLDPRPRHRSGLLSWSLCASGLQGGTAGLLLAVGSAAGIVVRVWFGHLG